MKILIVDDSPIMRKIIKKALTETKFSEAETVEAGDGAEAVKTIKNGGVDWIFYAIGTCRRWARWNL